MIFCFRKSGEMKLLLMLPLLLLCLINHGACGTDTDEVSVMEGDSVTLNTGVQTNQQDRIRWYYNDIRIAQINRDQSKICTDVQCNNGTERFRDRLKLDHQTGSLTITNTRNTDSGVYKLWITSSSDSEKIFIVSVYGVSAAEREEVKRKEGESVTLDPGVIKKTNDVMTWYFNDTLITEITGDQSKICTDVQCKERFRDRLKLDHQTGSLTIMNITNTDTGEYQLRIITSSNIITKSFIFAVYDFPVVEVNEKKRKSVKEGESVTLDTHVIKSPNDVMTWYFNDTVLAEITGEPNKTCTDVQCDNSTERFRDRLKLDHQTGSLTITNITNTHSGEYQLQINNSRFSIRRSFYVTVSMKSFGVNVTAVPDSGLSSGAVAGICVAVLLVFAVAAVIYYRHRESTQTGQYGISSQNNPDEKNGVEVPYQKFPTDPC